MEAYLRDESCLGRRDTSARSASGASRSGADWNIEESSGVPIVRMSDRPNELGFTSVFAANRPRTCISVAPVPIRRE